MKTTLSAIALSFALCVTYGATAQTWDAVSKPATDTVVLSVFTDGDYMVRRFVVTDRNAEDYSIRYLINQYKLMPLLDGNMAELNDLDKFMQSVDRDTLMKVEAVTIVGYASPDGSARTNAQLAERRAQDMKNYVDGKYDWPRKYKVCIRYVVDDWSAAIPAVEKSGMTDKQWTLDVLGGNDSNMMKEKKLKSMPAVWSYMKGNILPPMRRTEIWVRYLKGQYSETRILVVEPACEPAPKCCPCQCETVIDESVDGIIIEMSDPDVN